MQEHKSVLLREALYFLSVAPGKRYIDATIGGGGHAEAILQNGGEVLGLDQDPKALDIARRRLSSCPGVFKLRQGNFSRLQEIASEEGYKSIDGILFDLGFASFQVDDPRYGLSFAKEGPLDMRLSPELGVTAADLINALAENELYRLFKEVGQEKRSRAIARAIARRRSVAPIKTTRELRKLVEEVYEKEYREEKVHPATRTFMALRIAVNEEFENLEKALPQAVRLLKKGGRLIVISFHSGEDRRVKSFLKEKEKEGTLGILTKKPVTPSEAEVKDNPRARSAKLRAAEKYG